VLVRVAAGTAVVALALVATAQPAPAAFPGANGRIVFQGVASLGTLSAQGGDRQPLVTDGMSGRVYPGPQWSPDGTKVAFASNRDGDFDIYVVNADGSGLVNLTNNAVDDTSPAWSPDGRRITFDTMRDGQSEVYAMNADGSSPGNLTAFLVEDANPSWSPDGATIAYESLRAGNRDIWVMSPGGGVATARQLTADAADDSNPDWSPDSTRITFVRNGEIWTMRADGSGQASLQATGTRPAWSPDGTRIVYDNGGDLFTVNPNAAGSAAQLTIGGSTGLFSQAPSWQPLPIQAPPPTPPAPVPDKQRPAIPPAKPGGGTESSRGTAGVRFDLNHFWSYHGPLTRVEKLLLTRLSGQSKVTLTCKGSSCPFHRWSTSNKKRVDVKPRFRRKLLRQNTRIEVRITQPRMNGASVTFVTRVGAVPRLTKQCIKPGASKPTRRC
jgi:hypothetical protein